MRCCFTQPVHRNTAELVKLILSLKSSSLLDELSKAKVTKLCKLCLDRSPLLMPPVQVRQLMDAIASIPNTLKEQQAVVKELIQWASSESRVYLKQYLDVRLVAM